MPDTSLESPTGLWCPWCSWLVSGVWHNFTVSNKSEVSLTAIWWPWHFSGVSDPSVLSWHHDLLCTFFIKPFLAPSPISLTIPSCKVLAVLFPDCQKSVLVVLKTENRPSSVKTQLCSTLAYTVHKLYIHTVHKLYIRLTHPKQLGGIPAMFLVSLTGVWCPWCPRKVSGVSYSSLVSLTQLKSEVFLAALWWPWPFSGVLTQQWCLQNVSCVPYTSLVCLTRL